MAHQRKYDYIYHDTYTIGDIGYVMVANCITADRE